MALLDPKLYSNNVLVVGDGNFSFTVCLASALSETLVKIVATSLDSCAALANNDFAVENIEKLSAFQNVEILHEVDATNLCQTFGSRIFDRVIFNFPHIGGKSNIGKSRELLERFFASAARHVEPYKGDICVSLCQGQGGTPLDNPRRELGNTWQVVHQAAKAGTISSIFKYLATCVSFPVPTLSFALRYTSNILWPDFRRQTVYWIHYKIPITPPPKSQSVSQSVS